MLDVPSGETEAAGRVGGASDVVGVWRRLRHRGSDVAKSGPVAAIESFGEDGARTKDAAKHVFGMFVQARKLSVPAAGRIA
jgi:hypothetical protein